ncbi:MAG: hypothetical protein ACLUKN_10680 [Bacilli bacterium]
MDETRHSTENLWLMRLWIGLVEKTKLLEAIASYLNYDYEPIPPANIRKKFTSNCALI